MRARKEEEGLRFSVVEVGSEELQRSTHGDSMAREGQAVFWPSSRVSWG